MLFTFPEDAGWKAERHAPVGSRSAALLGCTARVLALLPERPPEVCRRLLPTADPLREIAKRKIRRRQLTEDANVEISGRELP